ncbi:hypothetical protein MBAV_000052 [Candidatus Magnetobacterium bavaricum]|uniref:Uncharacterized protein n=1 Tax=Candidatus Magnetobacterium bavaricum TaxID=29290 RepID=A0A0F3H0T5_9BACT|nr:hypothetical protein MBAV_000052 [Candidatus Magnetobacterium bavaricum]
MLISDITLNMLILLLTGTAFIQTVKNHLFNSQCQNSLRLLQCSNHARDRFQNTPAYATTVFADSAIFCHV